MKSMGLHKDFTLNPKPLNHLTMVVRLVRPSQVSPAGSVRAV